MPRAANTASAQTTTDTNRPSQTTVRGTGSITAKPDTLKTNVGAIMQSETVKDGQSKAGKLAGLSNMKLGKIVNVTEASANIPGPVYDAAQGGKGGGGIVPGQQTVQVDLVVTYEAMPNN
ncbi:MAG: SIMPL domain-containing protein [Chloroflexia bacterium]